MSQDLVKVGEVIHYYTNISVAVIDLTDTLKVGDNIVIKGATTEFTQLVKSIQIEHNQVNEAGKGDSIGLKVKDKVRKGDHVYKIES
jgi:putative protease